MDSINARLTILGEDNRVANIVIHTDYENLTMIEYEDGKVECFAIQENTYAMGMQYSELLANGYLYIPEVDVSSNYYLAQAFDKGSSLLEAIKRVCDSRIRMKKIRSTER